MISPTPTAVSISLCLIVRNEEKHLERCLASVAGLVQEVIVVDTGSTDKSREIAALRGARVIDAPWEQDFSAARNLALGAATGRWILVLDADEWLLPSDREAIRETVRTAGAPAGFSLLQASTSASGVGGILVAIVRLFPRHEDIRYEWPIHEQVVTSLERLSIPVITTGIRIQHSGYADAAVNLQKQRRNLAILERQEAQSASPHPLNTFLAAGAYLDLGNPEKALAAYRRVAARADAPYDLAAGARVRMVTCLMKLGRPAEAIAVMPPNYTPRWHPELVAERAAAEKALGDEAATLRWTERIMACLPEAQIPPCNVASLKAAGAAELAGHWRLRGSPGLAIAILRAARAAIGAGQDFTPSRLSELYRQHGVARAVG